MKNCFKCGVDKDYSCFNNDGKAICKDCRKAMNKLYYSLNKKAVIAKVTEYAANNKEIVLANKKQYYENNKEILLPKQRKYYHDNIDAIKPGRVQYRLDHKEDRNKHQKERYDSDPTFKLRVLLSTSVLKYLKIAGSSKNGDSVSKYFSYTAQELREHLETQFEPWMTWNNHGKYNTEIWDDNNPTTWTWQIDHIIPHSKLPYISMEDENFKKCWTLENLRPLSAKQNNKDGNKR